VVNPLGKAGKAVSLLLPHSKNVSADGSTGRLSRMLPRHFRFCKPFGKAGITDIESLDEQSICSSAGGKGPGIIEILHWEKFADRSEAGNAGNIDKAGLFEQSSVIKETGNEGKAVSSHDPQLSVIKEAGNEGKAVSAFDEQSRDSSAGGRGGKLVKP
jgi:hypothetical protein